MSVTRDIVGASPLTALHKMRDQALLYGVNYLGLIVLTAILSHRGVFAMSTEIVALTVALTILEGFASALYDNANSLNQQLLANAVLFVRTGLWVFPVVILGLFFPAYRTAEVAVVACVIGGVAAIALNIFFWRAMPWREALGLPVDWNWLKRGVRNCVPIWLGGVGVTGGQFVDRFFVEHYLTLDDVGVLTFYFSFANALLTLIQSGVLSFAYPRLIATHRDGDGVRFRHEARQTVRQVALGGGIMALVFAVVVPLLGVYTQRPALIDGAPTLWLLLLGVWIRLSSEALNYVLYARHQDRAIWLGNLLFLIPAIGGNALLIPLLGLSAVGWTACLSATLLFAWRWWHIHEEENQRIFFHAG